MLTFKNMHLEVYKRDTGEGMVSIQAQDDRDAPRGAGLNYISFYFTHREFESLLTGKIASVNDLMHNVRRFGEQFTFYDLDSCSGRGTAQVPFVNLQIPVYVQKLLLRVVRKTLERCENDGPRLQINLSYKARERWARLYGQGTGVVKIDMLSDAARAYLQRCEAEGGDSFAHCMRTLRNIAQNTTYRASEIAYVQMSQDMDGFYFRIVTPKGRQTLNGGVVNHGARDGKHDWSVHT